jgi:hypothetical protein
MDAGAVDDRSTGARTLRSAIPWTAMKRDFAQLYAQLDLAPGCSLEEFKRAYRRRIADQHPDRPGAGEAMPETQIPLPELIPLYVAAIRFHRQHGRLPGAMPGRFPGNGPATARTSWPSPAPANAPPDTPTTPTAHRTLVVALLLLALLALQTSWDWYASRPSPASAATGATRR